MPIDTAKLIKRINAMYTSPERLGHQSMWADLSEFLLNNQSGVMDSHSKPSNAAGRKKTKRVFTSLPGTLVDILVSAYSSLVTNPSTIWSRIRESRDELNDNPEVALFLEKTNTLIHKSFNESNFYSELGKFYQSYIVLGNAVLLHEVFDPENLDGRRGFKFTCLNMGQVAWAEGADGFVNTLAWKFEKTAEQAMELFGDRLPENVKKAAVDQPDKKFEFVHWIAPRPAQDVKLNEMGMADPEHRPYVCLYIEMESKTIVKEDGYYEFPAYCARFGMTAGEIYGRGRGHLALPDVRSLNTLCKEEMLAVAKDNRPPMLVPQRDVFGPLNLDPGSMNVVARTDGIRELVSTARTDRAQQLYEKLVKSLRAVFFIDQLILPPRDEIGQMREVEVLQRAKQISTVFGPVGLRTKDELLNPLLVRSFQVLLRNGLLPSIPEVLLQTGLDINVVFVNELENAQQIQSVQSTQQWLQMLAGLAQLNPQVLDIPDVDQIALSSARAFNVSEMNINSEDEIEQTRQQRAQQQQQQMQLEQMNLAADSAAKASNSGLMGGQ